MRPALACVMLCACLLLTAARSLAADATLVLDESCYWRHFYQLGPSRYSEAALKAEGDAVLTPAGMDRLGKDTANWMAAHNVDPKEDWRKHAHIKLFREPFTVDPPPASWSGVDFDDRAWPLQRYTLGGDTPVDSPESLDRGLLCGYYRARFVLSDPAQAGPMTLKLVYRGGLRALVNGTEVGRGGLPAGEIQWDTPAQDYPLAAYQQPSAKLCNRETDLTIPAKLLQKGANVLALEIHASPYHPITATWKVQHDWCDKLRPWPHAHLVKMELRDKGAGAFVKAERPAGVQAWAADIHHRTTSDEFLPPGEAAGVVRMAAARNGTCSGQIVIGSKDEIAFPKLTFVGLTPPDNRSEIPAISTSILYPRPFPLDEFTMAKLGNEKGVGGDFPTNQRLAELEQATGKACIFDHLAADPPARLSANSSRPVWVSVRVLSGLANPGVYRGSIRVEPAGAAAIDLPLEIEVLDWTLPDPAKFHTIVACEENPYGVAKQYRVPLWSPQHFKLMEASFAQLGRLGNQWVHVPILRKTEFGNRDDSMVRWFREKDGSFSFDFTTLDAYLDAATKAWGRAPMVNFVVMHGTRPTQKPPADPEVMVTDKASGRTAPMNVQSAAKGAPQVWTAFAQALMKHMEARGVKDRCYWGYPADGGDDMKLMDLMDQAAPGVHWSMDCHCLLGGLQYEKDNAVHYKVFDVPRYWGDWKLMRNDLGWKSQLIHLLSPRIDGTDIAIHTTSYPFAYRAVAEEALARGRNGIARIGADRRAGIHLDGMDERVWVTGVPVLFTLWPGKDGAETSVRHEMLLEGIQEAEARIFIEDAIDRGAVPAPLAARATKFLARRLAEETVFPPNVTVYDLEKYHCGWRERSRELYQLAADVAHAIE